MRTRQCAILQDCTHGQTASRSASPPNNASVSLTTFNDNKSTSTFLSQNSWQQRIHNHIDPSFTVNDRECTVISINPSQSMTQIPQAQQFGPQCWWHRFHKHNNSVLSADDTDSTSTTIRSSVLMTQIPQAQQFGPQCWWHNSQTQESVVHSWGRNYISQSFTNEDKESTARSVARIHSHIDTYFSDCLHSGPWSLANCSMHGEKNGMNHVSTWNGTGSPSHILVHCHSNRFSLSKSKAHLAWPYITSIILILSAPTSCCFSVAGRRGKRKRTTPINSFTILACLVHFEQRTRNPALPTPPPKQQQQQQPTFDTLCCVLIVLANIKPCCYICCNSAEVEMMRTFKAKAFTVGTPEISLQS